jgi:hypothetical protein
MPGRLPVSDEIIRKARKVLAAGDVTLRSCARRFGVSPTTLQRHGLRSKKKMYYAPKSTGGKKNKRAKFCNWRTWSIR